MVTKSKKIKTIQKKSNKITYPKLSSENILGKPFPAEDVYPIATPINIYWRGLDVIKEHWNKTSKYIKEHPGTKEYEECIFWRNNLIIWACCTIESFVNMEGVSWMGEDFYKRNLERNKIVQKISLIYAIKYNRRLSKTNEILKNVTKLFEARNQLVHPKTVSANRPATSGQNWEIYTPEYLKKIIIAINGLIIKEPS